MTDELPTMTIKAIGIVNNEVKQPPPGKRDWWRELVSEIVVDSSLTEALDGLEEFSHIIVLCWMHQVVANGQKPIKVHPRGKEELPLVGRLVTRSPHRPNPIGKSTVRLLQRQGNILRVKGLDALDGTPVIDIKPYRKNQQSYIGSFNRTVRKECLGWQNYRAQDLPSCQKMVELFLERYSLPPTSHGAKNKDTT